MGDNIASSSLPTSPPIDRVTLYLEELSRKRKAIALVREEPQSPPRPSSPHADEATRDKRIQAIRERAQEAWANANGNPADGRWVFLTRLLKTGVTSGRNGRWVGTRTDINRANPLNNDGEYWINAETESEWLEWEARDDEERKLREKVENWKRTVEAQQNLSSVDILPPTQASSSTSTLERPVKSPKATQTKTVPRAKIATMKTAGAVPKGVIKSSSFADPLKDKSPFGFSVVKRTTTTSTKPKNKSDRAPKQSSQPSQSQDKGRQHIADFTDFSLLPPSFPSSAIATSTPKPKPASKSANARKPDIIPDVTPQFFFNPEPASIPFPLSPLSPQPPSSTSHAKRTSKVLETSLSLPALSPSSTSPRNPIQTSTDKPNTNILSFDLRTISEEINANNKRPAQPNTPQSGNTDSRALKKARTLPALPASPMQSSPRGVRTMAPPSFFSLKTVPERPPVISAAVPVMEQAPEVSGPCTPEKQIIPTLRDLLASKKKGKGKTASPGMLMRRQPTKTSHAEKHVLNVPNEPPPRQISPALPIPLPLPHKSASRPVPNPPSPPVPGLPVTDPYADDADFSAILAAPPPRNSQNAYDTLFDPYADFPLDSPTKSLSSLAGSDEEDDDDEGGAWNARLTRKLGSQPFAFDPPVTSTQTGPSTGLQPQKSDSWASIYGPASNQASVNPAASAPGAHKDSLPSSMPPSSGSQQQLKTAPPPSSGGLPAYNSQFAAEVARRVDDVDRLLERDTSVYDSWLREPTPEVQGALGEMDESP